MNDNFRTPGVYIDEIRTLPPSVVPVETAIPVFIGYTERNTFQGASLHLKPTRVRSRLDFDALFGGPFPESYTLTLKENADGEYQPAANPFGLDPTGDHSGFLLYYSLEAFYLNGGGPCFIVSVGTYSDRSDKKPVFGDLLDGLHAIRKFDEPTLILFPEATKLGDANNFHELYKQALAQCALRKDRFTIIDTYQSEQDQASDDAQKFRKGIGLNNLSYGAVYYPHLLTGQAYAYDPSAVTVNLEDSKGQKTIIKLSLDPQADDFDAEQSLFHREQSRYNALYEQAVKLLDTYRVVLPPSSLMAGVYAAVDNSRGVFKAPANVSLNGVVDPLVKISAKQQEELNVHSSGKSVNAIRTFPDKGTLVWGARTLDGNSREWKYVSVRRYFLFVEESAKKASEQFVYEPNDQNTWTKVRTMLNNFLYQQWLSGALQGNSPDESFQVRVGLGETMSPEDLNEGRMIVEIALAVVRPAEFIILRFSHLMQRI